MSGRNIVKISVQCVLHLKQLNIGVKRERRRRKKKGKKWEELVIERRTAKRESGGEGKCEAKTH